MKTRLFSILLILCLALSLLPVSAAATDVLYSGACGEHATWTLTTDGLLTISGTGTMTSASPYGGIRDCSSLIRRIVIEEGITAIDDWAFYCDPGDSSVIFQEESLSLPESLEKIGNEAFRGHTNLRTLCFGNRLRFIGGNAFQQNTRLESVTLPASLEYLGNDAFSKCVSLKHVEIPGNVKDLYPGVFRFCTGLESVVLHEGILGISADAFSGCTALTDVRFPSSLREIGNGAFQSCTALERVALPALDRLHSNAFKNCTHLKAVTLADGAQAICENAFSGCTQLEAVVLPDSVKLIEQGAFANCYALKSIRLPAHLTVIPDSMLYECYALETLTMPSDVAIIERNAFFGCCALRKIYYAGTVQQLQQTQIMPSGNSALENAAVYLIPAMPDPVFGFFDMPVQDNWAYPGIAFCLENGLMNGMGGGYFQPAGTTTRAQLVTILWRMLGEPEASAPAPFTDLTQDWCREAVAWAAESGITNGTSGSTFSPDIPVTREQMVTIFYRMCRDALKLDVSLSVSLGSFPDSASVSPWAQDAMQWAVAVKLISGVGDGSGHAKLQPQGSATRAQIATVMRNFVTAFHTD